MEAIKNSTPISHIWHETELFGFLTKHQLNNAQGWDWAGRFTVDARREDDVSSDSAIFAGVEYAVSCQGLLWNAGAVNTYTVSGPPLSMFGLISAISSGLSSCCWLGSWPSASRHRFRLTLQIFVSS